MSRNDGYFISKSIVSLLPSPCRATALSAARRLDTIDLKMELLDVQSNDEVRQGP